MVYAARMPLPLKHLAVLRLAPWGRDECIDYLLARYHDRCAAVMQRIDDFEFLCGVPSLWCAVLEELAGDETLSDVRSALRRCAPRLKHHTPAWILLEADRIVEELRSHTALSVLEDCFSRPLVAEVARLLDETLVRRLRNARFKAQPMAASLLHAARAAFTPGRSANLSGAYLKNARWPDIDLRTSNLEHETA